MSDLFPRAARPPRAVSLLQPWASLVFRCKAHETRSTQFLRGAEGETVVLHASARFAPIAMISEELHELCLDEFGCAYNYSLPLGGGLGTVRVGVTLPTSVASPISDEDRIAGDWGPSRFATGLTEAREWPGFIPAKGALSLWRWPFALSEAA